MFSSSTLVTCIASPNAPTAAPTPARDGSRAGGQLLLQLLPQPVRRADGRRRLAQLDRDLFGERRVEGRPVSQAVALAPARAVADAAGRRVHPPDELVAATEADREPLRQPGDESDEAHEERHPEPDGERA